MSQLRDENRKLKQLVADLTLDKHILQEAIGNSGKAGTQARHGELGPTGLSQT